MTDDAFDDIDPVDFTLQTLWRWAKYAESDPGDYRRFATHEVHALQHDLLSCIAMLNSLFEPDQLQ